MLLDLPLPADASPREFFVALYLDARAPISLRIEAATLAAAYGDGPAIIDGAANR
jgi:hypothetical protein